MKKWMILLLATFLTYTPVAQETDGGSEPAPSQNTLSKSQIRLKELIKKLDKQIDELYEKEKIEALNERDLLKLDRLREARMIAELRLQTGYEDNDEYLKDLIKEVPENEEEVPVKKEDTPDLSKEKISLQDLLNKNTEENLGVPDTNADTDADIDTELARIKELLKKSKEGKNFEDTFSQIDSEDTETIEKSSENESVLTGEALAKKLKLDDSLKEIFLEIVKDSERKIKELEEEESKAYEELNRIISAEIPNYSDVYENSQTIAKVLYDKALVLIETKDSLRQVLLPEQFKAWEKITAKERIIKQKGASKRSESASVLNDGDVIYVPMKITAEKNKDGKTIYKAVP